MSRWGHKRMAALVADAIGVSHTLSLRDLVPHEPRDWRTAVEAEVAFVREEVVPLVRRRMRGEYDGDRTMPKWPDPVYPADGLKRLYAERCRVAAIRAG